MVDLILLAFCAAMFYGGFRAGATFGTLANMRAKLRERVKGWLA